MDLVIAAWAFQMVANALYAACPSHFGFKVKDGTSHGWTAYYLAVSFIYFAMALSKTAFATTLIRLSGGRTRTLLCTYHLELPTLSQEMMLSIQFPMSHMVPL